jgi:hypothetical protein
MVAMGREAERLEQGAERGIGRLRRGKPYVLLDRAPRQQPRLLNTMPSMPCAGSATLPSKSLSSPAMIRNNVVLPQPDGPTSAATSPLAEAERKLAEHQVLFS